MRKLTKARVLSQAEAEAMKEEERGRGQKSYGGTVGMATVVDEGILEMSILKLGFKARLCPFPALPLVWTLASSNLSFRRLKQRE